MQTTMRRQGDAAGRDVVVLATLLVLAAETLFSLLGFVARSWPFALFAYDWEPTDGDWVNAVVRLAHGLPLLAASDWPWRGETGSDAPPDDGGHAPPRLPPLAA